MVGSRKTKSVSRRVFALSVLSALTGASTICADDPDTLANNRLPGGGTFPVATRSVQLPLIRGTVRRAVVTAIAADPRGEFVAAAGDDFNVRILSSDDLSVVQTLVGHRDVIKTLAFDRDGEKLVSAGNDGQLIVWDRDADFHALQKLSKTPALACVRFSPEGDEIAAVGFDSRIFIMQRGKKSKSKPTIQCDCNDLRAIAYRDDNEILAAAGRGGVLHLFDAATGSLIGEFPIHRGRIHALEFQRDSDLVASVGEDGRVVVFNTQSQKVHKEIMISSGKLFSVSVLSSQYVAVGGSDNVIRIVNTSKGQIVRKLAGHNGSVPSLCSDGTTLFSGGFDATLRRWSLAALENQERIAEGDPRIDR